MKIIHICQLLGVGGLEKVLYSLIKEQVSLGHQVEVIVYDHDRRWVEKYRDLGIVVHTDYIKEKGYDLKLLRYLRQKLKLINPDIVHTHDLNPVLYIGVLKIFNPRLNLIHTTHGMEHLSTHPKTKFYELFLGIVCKKIIAVSPSFKEYYCEQLFTNKKKIYLVDNGTEIKVANKPDQNYKKELFKELGLCEKKPTAIYVARVVPLKAQADIMEKYSQIDHQLLIVGPSGNDQYYKRCEKLVTKNIKMLGSRDDILSLLQVSDYFISPSRHEGLPIAVLEAGAQSIPCLLSKIPGHTNFNNKSQCVLIFENLDELKEKTAQILDSKNQQKNFLKLIQEKYSSYAMAKQYLNIYQESL